jgi:DNA (cytosine-5)-methyltransferase 1
MEKSSKKKIEKKLIIQDNNKKNNIEEVLPDKSNIQTTEKLNVIDLFCGCGGMSKGLTDAGLNIIAGIDIWDRAVESYNKNFEHKAYCEDLTKLTPEKFDELYNKDNKKVDILVGGPPCQSYSIAGKRDKNDPRNSLFMEYVKYLEYFKPKAFIMENVIGMLSKKTSNGENVIDIIMEQLNKNYKCMINKLYASDFEVPQNRRRIIIVGIRKDLNILPKEPEPIIKSIQNRIPVKNILIPEEIEQKYYLSERALQGIQNKKEASKEKGFGFGAQFLNIEKPSYTIPARYWKDGYDALVKYNESEVRRLTITELKRIQSFPDNYIIEGTNKDIITQIGNAVACRFAYHLGKYITKTLQ